MSIQRRLLILLAATALLPLTVALISHLNSARLLVDELEQRIHAIFLERSRDSLARTADFASRLVDEQRRLLEVALTAQAREVERHLAAPGAPPLADLAPPLADLRRAAGGAIHRQAVILVDGRRAGFPEPDWPADSDPRQRSVFAATLDPALAPGSPVWAQPYPDPKSGRLLFAVAGSVRGPGGAPAGITTLAVDILPRLDELHDRSGLPPATRTVLAHVVAPGEAVPGVAPPDRARLRLLAERHGDGGSSWRTAPPGAWLGPGGAAEEGPAFARVLADIAAGNSGAVRLSGPQGDAIWAYGGVGGPGGALLFIMPFNLLEAAAGTFSDMVRETTIDQIRLTALTIGLIGLAVVILSIRTARAVTLPLRQLAETARRIGAGDLEARARVTGSDEIGQLGQAFNAMLPALKERVDLRASLLVAREVQQNLLPAEPPPLAGYDIAGHSMYCDDTGGDYYDMALVRDLPGIGPLDPAAPERLALAVGDVTGHGVGAALLMATVRAALRAAPRGNEELAPVLARVNRQLAADSGGGRFVTLFAGVLDAADGVLHWSSAGHEPALLWRAAEKRAEWLDGDDIPLGIDPDWHFQRPRKTHLGPGDVLVIGTDGLRETRGPDGAMFGQARLAALVGERAALPAELLIADLLAALDDYRGGAPQGDDITLLVVRRLA